MVKRIQIISRSIKAIAELSDSNTAKAIWDSLPLKVIANTWGDEVYFEIPVHRELENGKEIVQAGDLGFWPTGDAFCIFFGPTPLSKKSEIRPASAVNVFGKIIGDSRIFKTVNQGDEITITRMD